MSNQDPLILVQSDNGGALAALTDDQLQRIGELAVERE